MEGWWCVRYGDALACVEAPSAAAALRRSLDLHPLGDWTDDARKLAVFPQDAYPVGGSYAKTRIDTAKGERGFCTESDARSVIAVGGLSRQVDHSTIYRWVQRFAPEMEKRLRWQWRRPRSRSWRIDETYVRVRGQWAYLYRALDKFGNTLDFYLSSTRNTKAAKRFLGKALNGLKDWELPEVLNTDKAPTYAGAIAELKAEGKCPNETRHRQVKYLNNVVEADHGKLKLLLRPVRGFKTLKTAYATIKGFEVMRKGQAGIFALQDGIVGEARIVERAFGLGPCALTEVMALLQNRPANAEA